MIKKELNPLKQGERFGKLVILERVEELIKKKINYLCLCDCGKTVSRSKNALKTKNATSCGCARPVVFNQIINIGDKFGKLVVINQAPKEKKTEQKYICQCECGKIVATTKHKLNSGKTKSCGCLKKIITINIGDKFNRLTVIELIPHVKGKAKEYILKCDCGNIVICKKNHIYSGNTQSCGCLGKERRKESCTSHGLTYSREYLTWQNMKKRTGDENNEAYKNYGGRGITICDRWLNSFENFLKDMGMKPSPKHTIERVDNDGNYTPENCKWGTRKEQMNNMRKNHKITYNGKTQNLNQWSEETGMPARDIRYRLHHGWTVEETFKIPLKPSNRTDLLPK